VPEEGRDPVDHVGGGPFSQHGGSRSGGHDIVKASIDVEEESGDPKPGCLKGSDFMRVGQAGVIDAEVCDRAVLVRVEESFGVGDARKPDSDDLFPDFRYCFLEDDDTQGGRGVLGDLFRLVQDDIMCILQGGKVVSKGNEGGQKA